MTPEILYIPEPALWSNSKHFAAWPTAE